MKALSLTCDCDSSSFVSLAEVRAMTWKISIFDDDDFCGRDLVLLPAADLQALSTALAADTFSGTQMPVEVGCARFWLRVLSVGRL
jgi:hypothetical protein